MPSNLAIFSLNAINLNTKPALSDVSLCDL